MCATRETVWAQISKAQEDAVRSAMSFGFFRQPVVRSGPIKRNVKRKVLSIGIEPMENTHIFKKRCNNSKFHYKEIL